MREVVCGFRADVTPCGVGAHLQSTNFLNGADADNETVHFLSPPSSDPANLMMDNSKNHSGENLTSQYLIYHQLDRKLFKPHDLTMRPISNHDVRVTLQACSRAGHFAWRRDSHHVGRLASRRAH